jgi:hypothetical protein
MAETIEYGRFAAVRPGDTNETDLYACGAGEEIVGKVFICNQDNNNRTFRLALTDAGAGVAASPEDFIEYDTRLEDSWAYHRVIEISEVGTIRVQADAADKISFVLMGMRKTTT